MKDGKREENLLPFFGKVEKMKKLALFMLTMLMVFTLAACGDDGESSGSFKSVNRRLL